MVASCTTVYTARYTPPRWISLWFWISTLLVLWDAGYCLLRPRSMEGGDLFWLWSPYSLYAETDLVYGQAMFERGDGFTSAQAIMNLIESFLNAVTLYLFSRQSPVAILAGFSATLMTASKTVLYWLCDQQSGWALTGHNSRKDWWILFAIPNGAWIVFPTLIAVLFGQQIALSLRVAARMKTL
ncbi:hypothetical protein JCM11641_003455 [Rhodosporidiobolus odoratus]